MSTADFPTMTTAEIRSTFLNFFEERGLKLYPSSSLVPEDPSLLLANAGMNQFKEYYQGKKTMKEIGACSCQKCVRTNDIDCIGEDGRHLSFFEMLGDFSFGGVSKQQACAWAFELITEKFKLPLDRLYFTVFTDDDETHDVWRSLGVPEDHISRLGEDDNFWAAGPTGPCGPCSEIYFDQGEDVGCGKPDCMPGCDCDRFLEFWNLVFTQYDRQEDGSMPELPHRNLDTGMGLERMAAILQHKSANYDGDIMQGLIKLGEQISGKNYDPEAYSGPSRSLRIIADHARAVDFMISDGILPGNEGREYVLRRLLRRAVFHGRLLGIEGAFLTKFIDAVNEIMGGAYPELLKNVALVKGIVSAEEERFSTTLDTGRAYLDEALDGLDAGTTLPGDVAFKLHDTYGFPIDLTVEIAQGAGHDVDMDAFDACMAEQKSRARAAANRDAWGDFNNVWTALSDELAPTEFDGYEHNELKGAKVVAIVADGERVSEAAEGSEVEVLLDRTPFYAEMGGQVGDTGTLVSEAAKLEVTDTKGHNGLYAHVAKVFEGTLHEGDVVTASIDAHRRELIRRNHTATHLLDSALKSVLGEHVNQAGSLVDDDRLRFDFTHFEALTAEQLHEVEDIVNVEIFSAKPVVTKVCDIEEAKAAGAVGPVWREVRRRGAHGLLWHRGRAVQPRAVRRHARPQHLRARPVQDCLRVLHGLQRPPHRGRDEPGRPCLARRAQRSPRCRGRRARSAAPRTPPAASLTSRRAPARPRQSSSRPFSAVLPTRSRPPWAPPSTAAPTRPSSPAWTASRPASCARPGTPSATRPTAVTSRASWPRPRPRARWPSLPPPPMAP